MSHILGPSTSFAGSPASRTTHSSGSRVCTTYAVLQTGPDVQPEGKGKTVVAWEESLSGGVMTADLQGEKNKRVAVVSAVSALKSSIHLPLPSGASPGLPHICPRIPPGCRSACGSCRTSIFSGQGAPSAAYVHATKSASEHFAKTLPLPLLYLLLLVTACRSVTSCCATTIPQKWRHFKGGNCRRIGRWKFELTRGERTSHGRDGTCVSLLTSQLT